MGGHRAFLRLAVELAMVSVKKGTGPFGAVVVRAGTVIGRGHNQVTSALDPTAHAEIVAIRDAAQSIGDFELNNCDLYTSCQPCPMCLGAVYWAGIGRVFFANTTQDAERFGFADGRIFKEFSLPAGERSIELTQMDFPEAINAFEAWSGLAEKITY